jgi:toxin CcdB
MSRQFDVFRNPSRVGAQGRPFIVLVQTNYFRDASTRVVVPLIMPAGVRPEGRLNPVIEIAGRKFYFQPIEITTIPTRLLRQPVASLEKYRYQIIAALDLVFTGI